MKIFLKQVLFLLIPAIAFGQTGQVIKKGDVIYLQNDSKNENTALVQTQLLDKLSEWGYFKITDNQEDAAYIMKLNVEASKGITATSFGGTSIACSVAISTKGGKLIWESGTYKSSPNGSNGFNAKKTAANKLARGLEKKYGK